MTYNAAARIQGYDTRCLKFDRGPGNNHYLIANTMSVPVLGRFWIATQRGHGYSVSDPWAEGVVHAQLIDAAINDRLTQSQHAKQDAAASGARRNANGRRTTTQGSVLDMLTNKTTTPRTEYCNIQMASEGAPPEQQHSKNIEKQPQAVHPTNTIHTYFTTTQSK